MKILHFADLHYNDKDHDEIERCVDSMIEDAALLKPDVILCSGDITDSQNLKLDSRSAKTICRQFSLLADIAPVAVVVGTPSHDGKSSEILRYVRGRHNIYVSEKPEQIYLSDGRLHLAVPNVAHELMEAIITQIPAPTKQFIHGMIGAESGIENMDVAVSDGMATIIGAFGLAAEYASPFIPHIVNGHFQVGGAYISDTQQLIGRDIEISPDQLEMANADLICLGHIHKSQVIQKNIFYSGSIFHKDFGETDAKGFYIHEITPVELDEFFIGSKFLTVPATQKITVKYDFTVSPGDTAELDNILYSISPEEVSGADIKVDFQIWHDQTFPGKDSIINLYKSGGAREVVVNITRVPRETVRAAKVLELQTLIDKIDEMAALRNESIDQEILKKAEILETTDSDGVLKLAVSMAGGAK